MPDHDALFANLAAALRPGGWLVAQCGGVGNIATIQRGARDHRRRLAGRRPLRDVARHDARLDAAGFVDIECWLTDEPTRFEAGEPFETYLRTVVLGAHLERLPAEEHDAFVQAVADGIGEPVIDYVRLNIVAAVEPLTRISRVTRNAPPWPGMTMSAAARTRARPASIAAWSSPSGSISGVRSSCHHRWVIA